MSQTMHALRCDRRLRDLAASLRTLKARMRALLMHTAAVQEVWSAAMQRNLDRSRRI